MTQSPQTEEGLRERKRRDTHRRIVEAGLELFLSSGYEETTLDQISAAAGISRRTFFYYFKSKDEILLAWQSNLVDALHAAIMEEGTEQSPLHTLSGALLKLASRFNADTALSIAKLLKSNPQLYAANQAKFLKLEQAAFEALCRHWPRRSQREQLRIVAAIGLSAFRVAIDEWTEEGGKRPFATRVERTFSNLRAELPKN